MKILLRTVLIISFVVACHSQRKSLSSVSNENFDEFYLKFHNDSLFQLQRIIFPLEGGKYDYDSEEAWTPKNWQIKKVTVHQVDLQEYSIEFDRSDTLVFERIYLPNSGFDFQCRYRLMNGKWYLFYCIDQNL